MARLMKSWLGEYVAEELGFALEWKHKLSPMEAIKSEPADNKDWLKQEPSELLALPSTAVAQRVYEDDGSNLRVKLRRTIDIQSVLQIVGFVSYDNPVQAVLSDSYTRVRATFSSIAIQKFTDEKKRRITEETRGGVINIYDFELVATRHGPPHEHISLLITDFVYIGSGNSRTFGDPKPIEEDDRICKLLRELWAIQGDGTSSGHAEEAQHREPAANSQVGVASQIQLATQVPGAAIPARLGSGKDACGRQLPKRTKATQPFTDKALANGLVANVTDSDAILKLLHKNRVTGSRTSAEIIKPTRTTKAASEVTASLATPIGTTMSDLPAPIIDISSSLPSGQKQTSRDLNVGTESHEATARGSRLMPVQQLASVCDSPGHKSRRLDASQELAQTRGSPFQSRHVSKRTLRHSSLMDLSQLTRALLTIPSNQQNIIARTASWIPSEPGSRFPLANIPLAILQSLRGFTADNPNHDIVSHPISNATAMPSRVDQQSENSSGGEVTDLSSKSSEPDSESDGSTYPWGSSPPRMPRNSLPPDSSALASQIVKKTPYRGMFSRPPLSKPPEYSDLGQDSSSSHSGTDSSPRRQPLTKPRRTADHMNGASRPTQRLTGREKPRSQLSTPARGSASQISKTAATPTYPTSQQSTPREHHSQSQSVHCKTPPEDRDSTSSDIEMTGVKAAAVIDQRGVKSGSHTAWQIPATSPSTSRAHYNAQIRVAETPITPAKPPRNIGRSSLQANSLSERRRGRIPLEYNDTPTHDLGPSTPIIPATSHSLPPLGSSVSQKLQPAGEAVRGAHVQDSPQMDIETVSLSSDKSISRSPNDAASTSRDKQKSSSHPTSSGNKKTPPSDKSGSPHLVDNQRKRRIEGPLSGSPRKRIRPDHEPNSFGFTQEEIPSQDPRRVGREIRREFFRQERRLKNTDLNTGIRQESLLATQHRTKASVKTFDDAEMRKANNEPGSAGILESSTPREVLASDDSSRPAQGSGGVAIERKRKSNDSAKMTTTPTGPTHQAVLRDNRLSDRKSTTERSTKGATVGLKSSAPTTSPSRAGQQHASGSNAMPIRPRGSDIPAQAQLSGMSAPVQAALSLSAEGPAPKANGDFPRRQTYFAAPRASANHSITGRKARDTAQTSPKAVVAEAPHQATVPRRTSPHRQAEMPRLGARHLSDGHSSVFERFTREYREYRGTARHFLGLCRMMKKLEAEDRMLHPSLWDDFVIRHNLYYQPYLLKCSTLGEDPIPFVKFYNNEVESPKFLKRVLTPITLDVALSELEGPSETVRPLPVSTPNATSRGQVSLPAASSSTVTPSKHNRAEGEGSRSSPRFDRDSTARNHPDTEARLPEPPSRSRFAGDSYRPAYPSSASSIRHRPNNFNAESPTPAAPSPSSSSHLRRSLPWGSNTDNHSKPFPSSSSIGTPKTARRAHSAQTINKPVATDGESDVIIIAESHTTRDESTAGAKVGKTPITDRILGKDGRVRRNRSSVPQKLVASSSPFEEDKGGGQRSGVTPIIITSSPAKPASPSAIAGHNATLQPTPSDALQIPPPEGQSTDASSEMDIDIDKDKRQPNAAPEPEAEFTAWARAFKRLKIFDGILGPPDDGEHVTEAVKGLGKLNVLGWSL